MSIINTVSCTHKGQRCTAIDKKRNKWVYDAQSDSEAELMSEAVVDRGWIDTKWWSKK
jgi:hypothetical protein